MDDESAYVPLVDHGKTGSAAPGPRDAAPSVHPPASPGSSAPAGYFPQASNHQQTYSSPRQHHPAYNYEPPHGHDHAYASQHAYPAHQQYHQPPHGYTSAPPPPPGGGGGILPQQATPVIFGRVLEREVRQESQNTYLMPDEEVGFESRGQSTVTITNKRVVLKTRGYASALCLCCPDGVKNACPTSEWQASMTEESIGPDFEVRRTVPWHYRALVMCVSCFCGGIGALLLLIGLMRDETEVSLVIIGLCVGGCSFLGFWAAVLNYLCCCLKTVALLRFRHVIPGHWYAKTYEVDLDSPEDAASAEAAFHKLRPRRKFISTDQTGDVGVKVDLGATTAGLFGG